MSTHHAPPKPNSKQRRRRSAGFAAMNTKRAPGKSERHNPGFIAVGEPRVIMQNHPTGVRPAMAKTRGEEIAPGKFKVKMVPVCRWLCRHINKRHNRFYIPPRRKR